VAPKKRAIDAMPLAEMASTGPEGIEGELVYVAGGGLEDYKDNNVKDKIVLAEFELGPARPWKNYVAGVRADLD